MKIGMSARRAGALALITATAASTWAAAPAEAATQDHGRGHHRGGHHQQRPSHRPAAGFRPVRTAYAEVKSIASPARGQVWFLERAGDGRLVLERNDNGRWSRTGLPVRVDGSERVKIHGSAANDVWLTAGGQLWHFEGRRWSRAGLPGGAKATTVFDVPGRDVYVGLAGDDDTTGIFRMNRGRWSSLGRPADSEADAKIGPTYRPTDLTRTDGRWFATWNPIPHNATYVETSFVLDKGRWTMPFDTYFTGHGEYNDLGAWLVPAQNEQLALGTSNYAPGSPRGGTCQIWVREAGQGGCTLRPVVAVGAAAVMPNRTIVMGGNDYRPYDKPIVQGTFSIRSRSGAQRLVGGDPGDRTLAMGVEAGTSMVWAATKKGATTTIQAWKG